MVLQRLTSRVALTLTLALVATAMFTAVRAAPSAQAATVSNHRYGYSVNLSWTETRTVASYGTVAGCGYLAARLPSPPAAAVIAVGCLAISNWSKYAYRYGYCVSFKLVRYPRWTVVPWLRYC